MFNSIVWGGDDPFTHMLCTGPTRCGKTATVLKPIIYQLLLQKKRGKKLGFSLIEPKGDLARDVKEYCDEMEIPYIYIDPESEDSHRFNVMEGETDDVAEATVAVLQSLFGKQEAFYQTVQELSTRNITKLLKEIHGDDLDLIDVLVTLRDEQVLRQKVAQLRQLQGKTDLVDFFESELLGSLGEKYRQLIIGLRSQLENITGNKRLKRIISGKSDINIDKHFENGGVLIVNTSLGLLRKAGDAFGQFVAMHLQSGTFRRKGTERTRIPHFFICDEYSRYINPDVEMFLSIAASYRVAGIFAIQSLGQLEVESGKIGAKAMKQAILTSCRNKIAFSGLSAQDAKEFAEEFGKNKVTVRQSTYKNRILFPRLFPDNYRDTEAEEYRYPYTYLQDGMKRFHYVARLLHEGTPQKPIEGVGQFVPRDWKERREWEIESKQDKPKSFSFLAFKKRSSNKLTNQSEVQMESILNTVTETENPISESQDDLQEQRNKKYSRIELNNESVTVRKESTKLEELTIPSDINYDTGEIKEVSLTVDDAAVQNQKPSTEKERDLVFSAVEGRTSETVQKQENQDNKYNDDNFW